MTPKVTQPFVSSNGVRYAAVVDFDGVPLLARLVRDETFLEIWGPARGTANENPGWRKLDELIEAGQAKFVRDGHSISHNDHHVWLGDPIPGLNS